MPSSDYVIKRAPPAGASSPIVNHTRMVVCEPRAAEAAARCGVQGGTPALELDVLAARLAAAAVVGAATGRSSVLAAAAALVPGAAASESSITGTLCTITNLEACSGCSDGCSAYSWTSDCGSDISGSGSDNAGICDGTYTGNTLCASAAASRAAGPGRAAARSPRPCRPSLTPPSPRAARRRPWQDVPR